MRLSFTTRELAAMKLPGYPGTSQGWDKLVRVRGWPFIESHGRGRGGVRREFMPPEEVLKLIEAVQHGEIAPAAPKNQAQAGEGMTVRELAMLGLDGFPATERAWLDLVKREGWAYAEVPGRGRGGMRREFTPPANVLALITAKQKAGAGKARKAQGIMEHGGSAYDVAQAPEINATALGMILGGILQGMGDSVDPLKAAQKAVQYYQEAVRDGLITATGIGNGGAKSA